MIPAPPTSRRPGPRVLVLLAGLYLAQGLPFGFFIQALPVILRERGESLEVVGLSALLALPWALKFLWAPFVDRYGSRRGWILTLQALLTASLAGLAVAGAWADHIGVLMAAVFATNLLAATQDIATDGLAVALLPKAQRGIANGIQVAAYRLGMILGGGLLLILFEYLGWTGTFAAMAAIVGLVTLPVIAFVPRGTRAGPRGPKHGLRSFLGQSGAGRLLLGLVVFKAGEAGATGMLRPFLVDRGLSLSDVGWVLGTVGFTTGLVGALVGGWAAGRPDRRRTLTGFAVLQAAAVGAYALLALRPEATIIAAALVVGLEHFTSGLATAALFTVMMDRCRIASASTDYTVQASAVVVATGSMAAVSGFSAGAFGYAAHFAACTGLALIAVVAVPWIVGSAARDPLAPLDDPSPPLPESANQASTPAGIRITP